MDALPSIFLAALCLFIVLWVFQYFYRNSQEQTPSLDASVFDEINDDSSDADFTIESDSDDDFNF